MQKPRARVPDPKPTDLRAWARATLGNPLEATASQKGRDGDFSPPQSPSRWVSTFDLSFPLDSL
jgi:hypothetical protein